MTLGRLLEVAGAAVGGAATVATAMAEADIVGWAKVLVPVGAAVVSAVIANRVTSERTATRIEVKLDTLGEKLDEVPKEIAASEGRLRNEMQTYYQRRGPS